MALEEQKTLEANYKVKNSKIAGKQRFSFLRGFARTIRNFTIPLK
jgi:hypothetical protein